MKKTTTIHNGSTLLLAEYEERDSYADFSASFRISKQCPQCGGREHPTAPSQVTAWPNEVVALYCCDGCGLVFSQTRMDKRAIGETMTTIWITLERGRAQAKS